MSKPKIWITWEIQRRNQSLSREIDATLYELIDSRTRVIRYISLTIRTLKIIKKVRPKIVFAQNPSIILSLLIVLCKKIFNYKAIIDEHNSGLFPLEGKSRILNWMANFIALNADFAIVTNRNLAAHVQSIGGQALIIPDPLPSFDYVIRRAEQTIRKDINILFICTWSVDEPYREVIEAARQSADLPIRISITGDPKNKLKGQSVPDNVFLTGFIPDVEYVDMLVHSDAVLVLTTRQDCLNCGAYEAVSLEKPGILSDTHAIRTYFRSGFIYSQPSVGSLSESLRQLCSDLQGLRREVRGLKHILESEYATYLKSLDALVAPQIGSRV